jgi:hypothetical protein
MFGFPLDGVACGAVPNPQREQLLDLLQREPQVLRVLDETEARHRIVAVLAIAGGRAPRGRNQAPPLVMPDCLDVHVGRVRDLTDRQSHSSALIQ